MGIPGLSRFIDDNGLFEHFRLINTRVIIDGRCLIHQIYNRSEVNCIFGGDYDKFANAVENFFHTLKECNIKPIVILNGGHFNAEFEFNPSRMSQRIEDIKAVMEETGEVKVLPINLYAVFKSVLSELEVMHAQCDYNGIKHTASIANHYKCPVLSEGSSFYIYDLPYGFVRISSVSNIAKVIALPDGSQKKYLQCKIYFKDTLLARFPLQDKTILALWATLAGNHYINAYDDLRAFYCGIHVMLRDRFRGLLDWMRHLSLNEAKMKVLYFVEHSKRDDVKHLIEKSISDYELKPTNMLAILNAIYHNRLLDIVQKSNLVVPGEMPFPDEFIIAFHKGLLTTFPLNIINFKRKVLNPQIEDFSKPSIFKCSRYIRKVIYGILFQNSLISSQCTETTCLPEVEEYEPSSSTTQMVSVKCLTRLENGEKVPTLLKIYQMQRDETRDFLIRVIRLDEKFFLDIEGELQLLFGCINFWFLETKPSEAILSALILTIIHFQLKESITEKNLEVNPVVEWRSVINRPSAKLVLQNFEKYIQKPVFQEGNSFDISIVHSYSQLQACIHDITVLNRLLNFPFEEPKLHKLLNGTMLFNLTKELQSRSNSESAVRVLLGRNKTFVAVYEAFIDKFV